MNTQNREIGSISPAFKLGLEIFGWIVGFAGLAWFIGLIAVAYSLSSLGKMAGATAGSFPQMYLALVGAEYVGLALIATVYFLFIRVMASHKSGFTDEALPSGDRTSRIKAVAVITGILIAGLLAWFFGFKLVGVVILLILTWFLLGQTIKPARGYWEQHLRKLIFEGIAVFTLVVALLFSVHAFIDFEQIRVTTLKQECIEGQLLTSTNGELLITPEKPRGSTEPELIRVPIAQIQTSRQAENQKCPTSPK